jgi:hypothetical protein
MDNIQTYFHFLLEQKLNQLYHLYKY